MFWRCFDFCCCLIAFVAGQAMLVMALWAYWVGRDTAAFYMAGSLWFTVIGLSLEAKLKR